MTQPAATSSLDELQAQINLVLEHTGRIFANRSENATINNSAKLRQVYNGAIASFHDALDVFEEEMAITRAVMRRDLAVRRSAQGVSTSDTRSGEQTASSGAKAEVKPGHHMPEMSQDTDVDMTGHSPEVLKELPPQHVSTAMPSVEKQTESQPTNPVADQSQTNQQAREPLQLDIPSGEHTGSDNPTDAATGTFSNYDFESLFNDPSAHPSPDIQPTGQNQQSEPEQQPAKQPEPEPEQPEPVPASVPAPSQPGTNKPVNANQTTTIDMTQDDPDDDLFNFGDLTTFEATVNNDDSANVPDDDNINSLLPGLESYANAPTDPAPTSTDNTFNIFDAAGGPNFGGEGASNNAAQGQDNIADQQQQNQQPQGSGSGDQPEPHDDTFDALMNFDNFDMGSFGNGDDSGDGDGSGGGAFDASFFDIS